MADDERRMIDPDVPDRPDGFRPRKKRPEGWLERAIADGSVRAPGAPDPDAGKVRTGTVIDVPVAEAATSGTR